MRRIVILAVALAALGALGAAALVGGAGAAAAESEGITVTGRGAVAVAPDRATLSFGIETRGRTAREAVSANVAPMRRVIAAIRAAGATELETQQLHVGAQLGERGDQGFVAVNAVSAVVRDLSRLAAVIDAAVGAGANQVQGPGFARSDEAALERQALAAAFADARARAQALAQTAGVTLGRPLAIVTVGDAAPLVAESRLTDTASTPIEPGEQQVVAQVTVTFAVS
jgi:uncharacterized protein YggE